MGLSLIVGEIFNGKFLDELVVTSNLSLTEAYINIGRLREALAAGGIAKEQIAHDDVSSHLHKAACMEVGIFGIFLRSYSLNSLGIESSHSSELIEKRLASLRILHSSILIDAAEISAGGDVADCSHDLKLSGSLVDRCDACVTLDTLASISVHTA